MAHPEHSLESGAPNPHIIEIPLLGKKDQVWCWKITNLASKLGYRAVIMADYFYFHIEKGVRKAEFSEYGVEDSIVAVDGLFLGAKMIRKSNEDGSRIQLVPHAILEDATTVSTGLALSYPNEQVYLPLHNTGDSIPLYPPSTQWDNHVLNHFPDIDKAA